MGIFLGGRTPWITEAIRYRENNDMHTLIKNLSLNSFALRNVRLVAARTNPFLVFG